MTYRFLQSSEQIMRKHILTLILGAGAGLLLSLYLSVAPAIFHFSSFIAMAIGIFLGFIILKINGMISRIIPWKLNIILRILTSIIIYSAISFSIIKILLYLARLKWNTSNFYNLEAEQLNLKLIIILTFGFFLYVIIEFLIYSYQSFSTGELHKIKAERKQIDLQLNALKTQLSPHFLFNSLNTASSLIHHQSDQAEHYIRRLASLYKYTINSYHVTLISLQEEISFAKDYFHLLKTRFGDQIKMDLSVADTHLHSKVPPLAIQMLIENAVKHNVINSDHSLSINISTAQGWINISNNKTKTPSHQTSFKIGLKNIQERYKLLGNRAIRIKNEKIFIASIPIIE